MTYDPRQGESPYLGMDDADDQELDLTPDARGRSQRATTRASAPGGTTRMEAQAVPKTIRRPSEAPRRGVAPQPSAQGTGQVLRRRPTQETSALPNVRQGTSVHEIPYVEPAPAPRRRPSFVGWLLSFALFVVGLCLRLAAIMLAPIFVVSAIPSDVTRPLLLRLNTMLSMLVPSALLGQYVYETPFGGVLRGDLAIASIILFVADWLCARKRSSLRKRRERGE